ncbi:hypothetical protein DL766_005431 [Monosporascus sp. MC13-8B]|uniref:Uncharacterized protein n=1 Tax=Monosporascus cannonballus TaxID=155416 RepID=A0ABY0GW34_9PEZI|nr:hypothetical protein DL762_009885 [Monosporascus cannonballus]RYO96756.1 hypothetical protein DL763_003032 [Monosporascus cannonballus]RYP29334.1 hypothetical protein DL766_005431 [Monosporascus sp. MC13-8B]
MEEHPHIPPPYTENSVGRIDDAVPSRTPFDEQDAPIYEGDVRERLRDDGVQQTDDVDLGNGAKPTIATPQPGKRLGAGGEKKPCIFFIRGGSMVGSESSVGLGRLCWGMGQGHRRRRSERGVRPAPGRGVRTRLLGALLGRVPPGPEEEGGAADRRGEGRRIRRARRRLLRGVGNVPLDGASPPARFPGRPDTGPGPLQSRAGGRHVETLEAPGRHGWAGDLKGFPPTNVEVGDADPLGDEGREFAKHINEANGDHRAVYELYAGGLPNGSWAIKGDEGASRMGLRDRLAKLRKWLE